MVGLRMNTEEEGYSRRPLERESKETKARASKNLQRKLDGHNENRKRRRSMSPAKVTGAWRHSTGVLQSKSEPENCAWDAAPKMQPIMAAALAAHLSLRDACRVSPEETVAVENAFSGLDKILYASGGFVLPEEEHRNILRQGGDPTYGELLPAGVDKLVRILGLDSSASFYDLGAGTGKAMLQLAAMEPSLTKAVGIELSPTRLEYATLAHERLQAAGVAMCPVELREGNIEQDIYRDATHVFVSSVCFDDVLLRKIAANLGASPAFRVLVSLRQLPIQPHILLLGRTTLTCSFHGAQPTFIYVRHGLENTPAATLAEFLCCNGACWLPPHLQTPAEALFIGEA